MQSGRRFEKVNENVALSEANSCRNVVSVATRLVGTGRRSVCHRHDARRVGYGVF